MPTEATEYVIVQPQVVGNPDDGYTTVYYSDRVRHDDRSTAIETGLRQQGHDDWLLAHLQGGTLVGLSWQFEDRPDDFDELRAIATTFGWQTPTVDVPAQDTPDPTSDEQPAATISLDEIRDRYDGHTCVRCGGAWFTVEAITLRREADTAALVPSGYTVPARCCECGEPAR